jgi:hypothetical protein
VKIAIIGTGIAGNVAAHRCIARTTSPCTSGRHVGGHTHTHRIELDGECSTSTPASSSSTTAPIPLHAAPGASSAWRRTRAR